LAPCPFYKLTISADGTVQLEPKQYTKTQIVSGKIIKSQISQQQLKQIISEFEKTNFYSLNRISENGPGSARDCPQHGSDDVTAITSITLNGKTKRLEHYHGCKGTETLTKLTNLENKIDEVVNIKQWFDCYEGKNKINLPF
jgi:hypothetical protein